MIPIGQPIGGKVQVLVDETTREIVVRLLTGIDEARLTPLESVDLIAQLGEALTEIRLLP